MGLASHNHSERKIFSGGHVGLSDVIWTMTGPHHLEPFSCFWFKVLTDTRSCLYSLLVSGMLQWVCVGRLWLANLMPSTLLIFILISLTAVSVETNVVMEEKSLFMGTHAMFYNIFNHSAFYVAMLVHIQLSRLVWLVWWSCTAALATNRCSVPISVEFACSPHAYTNNSM